MLSTLANAPSTPLSWNYLEEAVVMDEYMRSNLQELLLTNELIIKDLEIMHPKYTAQLKNGFRAASLVNKGLSPNIDEATRLIKSMRSHRKPLKFCRDTADRYVSQLTDDEFHGFFRMSPLAFDKICDGTF